MHVLIQHATYLLRDADRIERDCDLLIQNRRIVAVDRKSVV